MGYQPESSTEEARELLRAAGLPSRVFVPSSADVFQMANVEEHETLLAMCVDDVEGPFSLVMCMLGGSATKVALSILRSALPPDGYEMVGAAYDLWRESVYGDA